ncbi:MAG: hypothetical protein A3G38_00760 [Omnitrophica WOR_2 bacterium RIFCSPLOWO2_12_FULL_51_8]|nr:MAG: hypothetical protein A3G38_00760 [Omnitrophica WOR_2 bacterium RIFCSPLOWO2_12_FULL_51_8]
MAVKIYLPFCLFVFLLAGCALIPGYERIAPLVELGDSRSGIDNRMKEEEQLFLKLEKDARDNRLKKGASKSKIIFRYGEPILAKPVTGREGVKEFLLYRHPFRYFSSSMIYLYFDHRERLVSWEVIPPA